MMKISRIDMYYVTTYIDKNNHIKNKVVNALYEGKSHEKFFLLHYFYY